MGYLIEKLVSLHCRTREDGVRPISGIFKGFDTYRLRAVFTSERCRVKWVIKHYMKEYHTWK
jgi:hypothetical protein